MRLPGLGSYDPVKEAIHACLDNARNHQAPTATIDLKDLAFVNSSGICMLSRVILDTKAAGAPDILILGNKGIAWQAKSLGNFVKLWPTVRLELH